MSKVHGGRGIEDMLNLPHLDELMAENAPEEDAPEDAYDLPIEFNNTAIAAISDADGTDHSKSMDELYKETLDHSRTLMDLGFNVDDRSRRGIFEIAVSMYGKALDAKNSKRDMQLKAMKLALDQQKMALEERKFRTEQGETVVSTQATMVEDRNELIKAFKARAEEERNK